jgi:hypothetical protein
LICGHYQHSGCPILRVFCEGWESQMPRAKWVSSRVHSKIKRTRSIAAHPCKKRKDGAPSMGMV